jgi:hypothetical protein
LKVLEIAAAARPRAVFARPVALVLQKQTGILSSVDHISLSRPRFRSLFPMNRPALLVSAACLSIAGAAQAADLALKRVMLSTGGVGYFEYEATVAGDGELTLEVRRDQVDDVLKSVVVYDDRGAPGAVSLPGADPTATALRAAPFTVDDLSSPAALLRALRGAEVHVAGPRAVTGRILSVTEETVRLPGDGGETVRRRLTLSTAEGLRQLMLEEADSLRFTDPLLQAQLDAGLSALAQNPRQERRRLTFRVAGREQGGGEQKGGEQAAERRVRVAYVVAAPLWKAAYRLSLPAAGEGEPAVKAAEKGALQGWAVLENLSGEDWREVELTLASGAPVTLRQALYAPYFIDRPEAPVEVVGRVFPPADGGSVALAARQAEAAPPPPPSPMPRAMPPAAPAPGAMAKSALPSGDEQWSAPALPETGSATPAGDTAQVLFRAPRPVSAPDGGTLMVPIVAAAFPVERLALYQPGTSSRHPLAALRLTNGAAAALPPGLLTFYETVNGAAAFVGDARMAILPAGDSRLLSFAVDQAVTVDRSDRPGRALSRATVADGVLNLSVVERQTSVYTVAGAKDGPRKLLIEHPRRAGWELADPAPAATGVEATAAAYRLPLEVPAGGTARLSVTLERPRSERATLADLSADMLIAHAAAAELPAAVREALTLLAGLRTALSEKERSVAEIERGRAEQVKEQERLRANLAALPAGGDLHKRTLTKMGEAENRLEVLARDLAAARNEADAARRALAERIRGLKL